LAHTALLCPTSAAHAAAKCGASASPVLPASWKQPSAPAPLQAPGPGIQPGPAPDARQLPTPCHQRPPRPCTSKSSSCCRAAGGVLADHAGGWLAASVTSKPWLQAGVPQLQGSCSSRRPPPCCQASRGSAHVLCVRLCVALRDANQAQEASLYLAACRRQGGTSWLRGSALLGADPGCGRRRQQACSWVGGGAGQPRQAGCTTSPLT
jgi:hypothetical protein